MVSSLGEKWWQLRGWPVNWIIQLDPLTGLGTLLSTRALYGGLLWGLSTVVLTVFLGRFFCGWICPLGSLQHAAGFLGQRKRSAAERQHLNRYRKAQVVKYWVLIFFLTMAAADVMVLIIDLPQKESGIFWAAAAIGLVVMALLALRRVVSTPFQKIALFTATIVLWAGLSHIVQSDSLFVASLQTGLLDPISLGYRSITVFLLPFLDAVFFDFSGAERLYEGSWSVGVMFFSMLFLCFYYPRFYCRFLCPLGAMFGILSRHAIWRVGRHGASCRQCRNCESWCEGACEPAASIRISECVLCMNCMECRDGLIGYRIFPSQNGEILLPDITRRQLVVSILSGILSVPMIRLNGSLTSNWKPDCIRPPGALFEKAFLLRCIKCGQCMRICPTNVIQPALVHAGIEKLWTPVLNFRIGTSGCQLNCIACGNLCPTAAIRPISLDEKLGRNVFSEKGPVRIGLAFVDRGRCLPWAMDRPCIVCQENCPVSPKAIFTRETFVLPRDHGTLKIETAHLDALELPEDLEEPDRFSSGDYYCRIQGQPEFPARPILKVTGKIMTLSPMVKWEKMPAKGSRIYIQIRLQQPFVDPTRCTGCGICEHECPVKGQRAIRVTADNESRHADHVVVL